MSDIQYYKPELRLQALQGGPLRGSESYQFGFYDAGVLRHVIDAVGGGYKTYSLPIPINSDEFNYAQRLLHHEKVQYALVDKNKIVFVVVENSPGWMTAFDQLGYVVTSNDKTAKRLKSGHRPTLINAHFEPGELTIRYVEDVAYSRYDFSEKGDVHARFQDPSITERLLDGGFVISRRLIQEAIVNLPVFDPGTSTDPEDYYFDPRVRADLCRFLLESTGINIRIIFQDGMLKGNAFVVDPEQLPPGVDVLTSRCNVKKGFAYTRGYRLLAEPQGPKSRVVTDHQTVINFPKLFRKSDMEVWLREEYKKLFEKAVNGDLLTNWRYIYKRMWRDKDDINDNEARARMAYVGYRWTAAGFSTTHSPWLFETTAISNAAPLKERIPIPCAVYEQIIPESLVRMAGFEIEIEEGTIVRISDLGVHAVNDLDWLEMYESHGGHDEDDFFKLFYRTIEGGDLAGEKVVIAVRSPNGFGEYSVFRYVEDAWFPKWHKADGTEVTFPTVNGRGWPKRLSDTIYEGAVHYRGFPSASKEKVQRSGPYTPEDVIRDIRIAMAGGNVGGYVNACMAHSMVVGRHRPEQLCSLEDAIDKCINPDDIDDVIAIDVEAQTMMREVILSGKPIDETFWNNRGMNRFLARNESVTFYSGKISQIAQLCSAHYAEYCRNIKAWAQANARPPEIVHQIGRRMYHRALPNLRAFRMGLFNSNSSDEAMVAGGIERRSWESMYSSVVDMINEYERPQDRYDFVLGLYSVTLKEPTSLGKVTDQIVMNRFVYPYLEAALQYYGIADITMYDNRHGHMQLFSTRNTEWIWPNENGEFVRYDDPMEFQKAHAKDSPIIWTMPKPAPVKLTKSIV